MTETLIQDAITALYESTQQSPASTDDDYLVRRNLMNRAIHRWEHDTGYWWSVLWTNTATTSTGAALTLVAGTTQYAAPTAFRRASGVVQFKDSNGNITAELKVVKPQDARAMGPYANVCWFSGVKGAVKLNLNIAPTASQAGQTISYDFFKYATEYAATTDVSEITDPEYVIHSVVAELYKADNNLAAYQTSLSEAEDRLKGMEVAHVAEIDWNDNTIYDEQVYGFGV